MKTALALLAFVALSSTACVSSPQVIPDLQTVPHRVAQPTQVTVWARGPDGKVTEVEIEMPAGWWIASPQVVEGGP